MNKKYVNFFKNKNNIIIVIILIIGTLFMLLPSTEKKQPETPAFSDAEPNYNQELKKILSKIKGVGDVEVMITYSATSEKQLAYEIKSDKTDRGNSGYEENTNKQAVLSDGEPVILSKSYPKVKGVVVIAEGAGNTNVKANILDAVTTAFNIASHKVCILEK